MMDREPPPPPTWRFAADPRVARRLDALLLRQPPAHPDLDPVRWGRDALAAWGTELRRLEARRRHPSLFLPDRDADHEVALCWARCLTGDPWNQRRALEKRYLHLALRIFHHVANRMRMPTDVRQERRAQLREVLFYKLVGGPARGYSGLAEVALRTLETAGTLLLVPPQLPASACAPLAARLSLGRTSGRALAMLLGLEGAPARALVLTRRLAAEPGASLEVLLDLCIALRLVDSWSEPARTAPDPSLRTAAIVRASFEGRLRALAIGAPGVLDALLDMPALAARTERAVAQYVFAWLWDEAHHGWSWDINRPVTPPFGSTPALLDPIARSPALSTWVCLAVLRLGLVELRRWVFQHDADPGGDRITAVLGESAPGWDDGQPRGPGRTWHRLRAHLYEHLDTYLREWEPAWARIAALPKDRYLKGRLLEVLRERWHSDIPMPRGGAPAMQERARRALEPRDGGVEP